MDFAFNRRYEQNGLASGVGGGCAKSAIGNNHRKTAQLARKMAGATYVTMEGLLPDCYDVLNWNNTLVVLTSSGVYEWFGGTWSKMGNLFASFICQWLGNLVATQDNKVYQWLTDDWVQIGAGINNVIIGLCDWSGTLTVEDRISLTQAQYTHYWNDPVWELLTPAPSGGGIQELLDWSGLLVRLWEMWGYPSVVQYWSGPIYWTSLPALPSQPETQDWTSYDWNGTLLVGLPTGIYRYSDPNWIILGTSLGGPVSSICEWNAELIACSQTGVYRWIDPNWIQIGGAFGGNVTDLYEWDNDLIAGGTFTGLPLGTATLSTRISDNRGIITLDGLLTDNTTAILDLLNLTWSGGSRTKMAVMDVNVGDKELELFMGTGDVLPAESTVITAVDANVNYIARYNDTDGWR